MYSQEYWNRPNTKQQSEEINLYLLHCLCYILWALRLSVITLKHFCRSFTPFSSVPLFLFLISLLKCSFLFPGFTLKLFPHSFALRLFVTLLKFNLYYFCLLFHYFCLLNIILINYFHVRSSTTLNFVLPLQSI